ncbi:MAG: B-box zinc finger protein [Actinomycetota bacterium]
MSLINWLWLEELLVRSAEEEIAANSPRLAELKTYAFCLEFDVLDASIAFSFGTREDVERVGVISDTSQSGYRALELSPGRWRHARVPITDPGGAWLQVAPILEKIRENLADDDATAEAVEFTWLRFEYLAECVVQRLVERDAFRGLSRAAEFVAFAANDQERLEEVEDRLCKLYPSYNRATAEWAEHARPADIQAELAEMFESADPAAAAGELRREVLRRRACQSGKCNRHPPPRTTLRCTYCQRWFCSECKAGHAHPELAAPQPFFVM